ncbi:unnamed protein product [Dibothriocephalus latus]|uniref:Uncharacterized protein n=1 Tax=Dibothriocephalus latus TaxID=60516 RepID=A0A3P7NRF4_DIBLA|nr:unnamed protein product [Dibothriocephalus latus]
MYEASWIAAAKAKHTARKSHNQQTHTVTVQALSTWLSAHLLRTHRLDRPPSEALHHPPTASTSKASNPPTDPFLPCKLTAKIVKTGASLPSPTGFTPPANSSTSSDALTPIRTRIPTLEPCIGSEGLICPYCNRTFPPASALPVTCVSIAQGLVGWCREHQHKD